MPKIANPFVAIRLLAICSLLVFSSTACTPFFFVRNFRQVNESPTDKEGKTPSKASSLTPRRRGETLENKSPFGQLANEIIKDFERNDFAAIDAKAAQARSRKERFVGGSWKITAIYYGIIGIHKEDLVSDNDWQNHLAKLKMWKTQFPQSVTPRVALGSAYIEYAWFVRGGGFAKTVTDRAWAIFHQRLDDAQRELMDAYKLPDKCPEWYDTMLILAMAQGWDEADYNSLFNEAVKFEPNYYRFYYRKTQNLLPRWGGRKGDWEKFAETILTNPHGDEAKMVYYLAVADRLINDDEDFTDHERISWAAMKEGYQQLEKKYGTDNQRLNGYALMASMQEDMPEAYVAFKQIGDKCDEEVWDCEKRFPEVRNWAIARYEAENPGKK